MPKKEKLTPEELKARRAQKKLDKKRRLAEKKLQDKRDHLDREVKYGSLTIRRYEKSWRDMLVKVALPRMRQEMEYAWHNFERVVDAKDFTISLLMDEVRECEEQYMLNFRNHCEHVDKLIDVFQYTVEELKEDNQNQIDQIQAKCDEEFRNIAEIATDSMDFLKTMLYGLEQAHKERERYIRGEFHARLDEEDVKIQLVLTKLKAGLETKHQKLYNQTVAFIDNYNKTTRVKRNQHDILQVQDDAMAKLIDKQHNQVKGNFDTIRELRHKINDLQQIEGHKVLDMQSQRTFFSETFFALKEKLADDQKHDKEQMILLNELSNEALEFLMGVGKKGDSLLTLAAICRKLETLKEKILQFPLPVTQGTCSVREGDNMTLFWQRVGQAGCLGYALTETRKSLKKENVSFVLQFEDYCDRLMYPRGNVNKKKPERINVVDCTAVVKNYNKY